MLYLDSILSEATYINHGTIFGIFGAQIGSRTSPGELLVNNENPYGSRWLRPSTNASLGFAARRPETAESTCTTSTPHLHIGFCGSPFEVECSTVSICIYHKIQVFAQLFINQLWYQSRQTAVLVKAWLNCWWTPGYAPFLRMKPIVWS